MTLYHRSDQIIKLPELRPSIRTLDFGPGFYTTTKNEQAVNFTVKVYYRSIRAGDIPKGKFISIYEVDYETLQKELDALRFDSADETWFDFIIANRRSLYTGKKYDVIYGPVANDLCLGTLSFFPGIFRFYGGSQCLTPNSRQPWKCSFPSSSKK